ncbi:MAG: cytochrome c [Verrucomicrobiia bacterium]
MDEEKLTEKKSVVDVSELHDAEDCSFSVSRGLGRSVLVAAGVVLFAAFVGGSYFGRFYTGFRNDVFELQLGAEGGSAKAEAAQPEVYDPIAYGKKMFSLNCASCHQASGQGVAGQYPPLAGSEWVLGSPKRLAAIVLDGLEGPVTVKGAVYNGAMASWKNTFNDKKLSAILSYIRQEWGNQASPITEEEMTTYRAEFGSRSKVWSADELLKIP